MWQTVSKELAILHTMGTRQEFSSLSPRVRQANVTEMFMKYLDSSL